MKIELSDRLTGMEETATARMSSAIRALSTKGIRTINFSIGDPSFSVPSVAIEASIAALHAKFNRYTPVSGISELRQKISEKLLKENGLRYPSDQIAVTCGAKQSIYNCIMAAISPGDEVIIPSPYWTSYPKIVKLAGGIPVTAKTTARESFKLTGKRLKEVMTPRSKLFLFNSPTNPTGSLYSRAELLDLASALEGTRVLVCSDEIYEKLVFEGEFHPFASVSPDAFSRTVTVNGFSKSHAMTGWRLGYAAGPKPLIDAMVLLQGQMTSAANSIAQKGALAALESDNTYLTPVLQDLRARRDQMLAILSECALLSLSSPSATFYLFINVERVFGKRTPNDAVITNSSLLADYLLDEAHVGVVAGSGFGAEGYLRLSFALTEEEVEKGCRQMLQAIERLR